MDTPQGLPSKDFLLKPVIRTLGKLTNFKPGLGVTIQQIIDGVLLDLGYNSEEEVPFRVIGKRPNLRRNIYLILWNLGVERRQGHFWTVRMDADSNKEFRLSTKVNIKGKGKVGDFKPHKKNDKDSFLWGLTWFGANRALEFAGIELLTITSIYLNKSINVSTHKKICRNVGKRCRISAEMGMEEDHVQTKLTNYLLNDGLKGQLLKNMGYGVNPTPSQLSNWVCNSAYSEFRAGGKDAGVRAICGATTETERKKQAQALREAEENPDKMGLPAFPTVTNRVSCGSQDVSAVLYSGDVGEVSIEFVDADTTPPDDQVIYEEAMAKMEDILSRRFKQNAAVHIEILRYMAAGESTADIARKINISPRMAKQMLDNVRAAIQHEYELSA